MRLIALLLLPVVVPAVLLALKTAKPNAYTRQLDFLGRWLDRIGKRRRLVCWSSALFVTVIRVSLLPVWPIPVPTIPDEFGYLLLADTFASGRITNPPHPLWEHFETLFVLQQPTYASAYPVVQGLILAVPKTLGVHPWWGVWLSAGVMCAATCWALQGWLPPRWSLLGTAWTCLNLAVASYWMNSYWGGSASAIGGALVVGAAGRLRHRTTVGCVLLFGAGLAILANTRPYEGCLLGTTLTVWLAIHVTRRRAGWKTSLLRVGLPLVSILVPTGLAMSWYFWHVTGSLFRMPYVEYARQYAAAPAFIWQKPVPEPVYRHPDLREALLSFTHDYSALTDLSGVLRAIVMKLQLLGTFYLGPMVLLPVFMFWRLPSGRNRLPFLCTAVTIAGILLGVYIQPHYGAPLTPFVLIPTIQSLRFLWVVRRWGNLAGEFLVPSTPVICLVYAMLSVAPVHSSATVAQRPETENWLAQHGLKHVVIVHYERDHEVADEWVYNAADIDRASVVWARDMGDQRNRELAEYFKDRRMWLLSVGSSVRLAPYETARRTGHRFLWPVSPALFAGASAGSTRR